MAKVQRHVEIEEAHIKAIQDAFGGTIKLSYVLNELLYHFDTILKENETKVSLFFREAAERVHENLE